MFIKFQFQLKTIYPIRLMSYRKMNTCGIIAIGDELLKGNVFNTNSHFICKKLYNLGVQVKKISVIGDCVNEISDEVKLFSRKYTYVITTGGIGPTHDDVTFEAVAKAFDEPLVYHPVLVKLCSKFFNTNDLKSPAMKQSYIPKSSKLIFSSKQSRPTKYPLVNVNNVYVFPGVPQLLEKSFEILYETCFESSCTFYKKEICLQVPESSIVNILNEIVKEYPQVVFGSYPMLLNNDYQVKITVECTEEELVEKAYNSLLKALPKDYLTKT